MCQEHKHTADPKLTTKSDKNFTIDINEQANAKLCN